MVHKILNHCGTEVVVIGSQGAIEGEMRSRDNVFGVREKLRGNPPLKLA